MQALRWLAWRALTKLGIAIAAGKAMMATTIMISTKVNPALTAGTVLIFICLFSVGGVNGVKDGFIYFRFVHSIAFYKPLWLCNRHRLLHAASFSGERSTREALGKSLSVPIR